VNLAATPAKAAPGVINRVLLSVRAEKRWLPPCLRVGVTRLMMLSVVVLGITVDEANVLRVAVRLAPEVGSNDPLGCDVRSRDDEVGIDLESLRQFTPSPGLRSQCNNFAEAFLAFGGERICDQEFTKAKARFGLLFDELWHGYAGLPGHGCRQQSETLHRQHAQPIQRTDGGAERRIFLPDRLGADIGEIRTGIAAPYETACRAINPDCDFAVPRLLRGLRLSSEAMDHREKPEHGNDVSYDFHRNAPADVPFLRDKTIHTLKCNIRPENGSFDSRKGIVRFCHHPGKALNRGEMPARGNAELTRSACSSHLRVTPELSRHA